LIRCPLIRRPLGLAALIAAVTLAPAAARADAGAVTGTVQLADPAKRGEPPIRSEGFVKRARNALKAPRPFDPTPELIVVLVGGNAAPEDTVAPDRPVRYTIVGESFDTPILPVVVGSVVEVKNSGRNSPRLYSPGHEDFVPGDPVNPKGERKTKKVETPAVSYELRDRDSAHLSGRIVAFPHRYFARLGPGGKFEIKDVAAGSWNVRVWYANGWVDTPPQKIEVEAKREAKVKIALPPRLSTAPAN
jgi:hypothetical protein